MTHRSVYSDTGPVSPLFAPPLPAQAGNPVAVAAAVELRASGRDATQRDAVLAALRGGPKTTVELSAVALRYSARIKELRLLGFQIRTTPLGGGLHQYRLTGEPQTGGGE